jgi:hypothetical protein
VKTTRTEQSQTPRQRQNSQNRGTRLKRLLFGSVVGFALLEAYFLGLIPNFLGSKYVFLISVCLSFAVAMIEPGLVLTRTVIVVASISMSFAAVDLGLRPVLEPRLFGPPAMFMYSWAPMPSLWRYAPNVSFNGTVIGDLAARDYKERRHETFETDSYGFRNGPEQASEAQKGITDLILLGDSFGVGVGTTQAQTWASLFEGKYGLHTYNLSMAGSGPWHELMNLKIACPRLHCDHRTIVLWALFAGNDLQDPISDALEPSVSDSWSQHLTVSATTFRNMSPVRNVMDLLTNQSHQSKQPVIVRDLANGRKLIFRTRYVTAVRLSYDQVRLHPHYPKLVAVLDDMKKFSDSRHFSVVVVMIPAKEEVYSSILSGKSEPGDNQPSGFSQAVQELCQRDGLPYLDLKPFFLDEANKQLARSGELLWWSDDTHWNDRGHALAASIANDKLLAPMERALQSVAPAPGNAMESPSHVSLEDNRQTPHMTNFSEQLTRQ